MKRLLILAVTAAAAFGTVSTASAYEPRCPEIVCGERCFYTTDVRFCI